jgi:hypothetical protein
MPAVNKEIYDNLRRTSPAVRKWNVNHQTTPRHSMTPDVSLPASENAKNTVKGEQT